MSNCEGCGKPSHREWSALGLPNCGLKRCLVQMVVRRAGFQVRQFGPTAVASAGLKQLLNIGYMRVWGWRYALPVTGSGELIRALAGEVRRCEELENAGVPVPVADVSHRLQVLAWQFEYGKPMTGIMHAGAESAYRETLSRALRTIGQQPPPELDTTQFSISAVVAIVKAVTEKVGRPARSAVGDDRFVGGIFAFVASDHISQAIGGQFEAISSVATIALFFDLHLAAEGGALVSEVANAYNKLMKENVEVLIAIGQNIANWIAEPTEPQLSKLAALFCVCRENISGS